MVSQSVRSEMCAGGALRAPVAESAPASSHQPLQAVQANNGKLSVGKEMCMGFNVLCVRSLTEANSALNLKLTVDVMLGLEKHMWTKATTKRFTMCSSQSVLLWAIHDVGSVDIITHFPHARTSVFSQGSCYMSADSAHILDTQL